MQKIAADSATQDNVELELTFPSGRLGTQDHQCPDRPAGPDVAFCFFADLQTAPKFAWEGKLGDVSDLIKKLKAATSNPILRPAGFICKRPRS